MRGQVPKDPTRRARRNRELHTNLGAGPPTAILRWEPAPQPPLPRGEPWPELTRRWWANWGQAPQAAHLGTTDWDYLLDTARLHARFAEGNMSLAGELRQRVAKFGATPEDRLRLRMSFAEADTAEQRASKTRRSREDRYGEIEPLPGVERL